MIEQSTKKRMLIYSGSSNSELAKKVANELGTELAEVEKEQFASGEIYIRLADSARGLIVSFFKVTQVESILQLWNSC